MKLYTTAALIAVIFLSGCAKESIHEAMFIKRFGAKVKASFSFKLNGDIKDIVVEDAREQTPTYNNLAFKKQGAVYHLNAHTNLGGTYFFIVTDSLAIGNYRTDPAGWGPQQVTSHVSNNRYFEHFMVASSDYLSINITSHTNGYISGNFTGALTPLLDGGVTPYIYGPHSSTIITEGSFTNVPVYY